MTRAHLPAIDGLRAVAVLAVIAYHAGLPVPAGFVGVDVFFVISGYVITRLLAAGPIDFLGFYARRARRILPALVVLVVSVLIASAFLLAPDGEQQRLAKSAAASLLFAGNVFFQSTTGGYFDPSTETMPLLHLWSLGVEEQFYLLWPLLLVAARKYQHCDLKPHKVSRMMPALALGSFALAEAWLWFNPEAAFYQMPARFWELAVGGMIALYGLRREQTTYHAIPAHCTLPTTSDLLTSDGWRWRIEDVREGDGWVSFTTKRAYTVPGVMTAGLVLVLLACFVPLPHFPGAGALPAVVGAALVCLGAHRGNRLWLLESRPMVAVGLVSYSLYLWHWPALVFLRVISLEPPSLAARLVAVGIACVLAVASYRYVEQPFRRMGGRRRAVGVGVGASLVLALCAFSYGQHAEELTPAKVASEDRPLSALRCHQRSMDAPEIRCPARVLIWGDSMALAWQPFAQMLAEPQGMTAANASRDGCGLGATAGNLRTQRLCREFNEGVMDYVRSGQVDTLVLAWRWNPDAAYFAGLEAVVAEAKHHARVVVIGPSPMMKAPAGECMAKGWDCGPSRAEFDAWAAPIRARILALGVEVADPADFLCDRLRCPPTKDGKPLYWDRYHVSASAARAFARRQGTAQTAR